MRSEIFAHGESSSEQKRGHSETVSQRNFRVKNSARRNVPWRHYLSEYEGREGRNNTGVKSLLVFRDTIHANILGRDSLKTMQCNILYYCF